MTNRGVYRTVLAILLAALFAGLPDGKTKAQQSARATAEVTIASFSFRPFELRVPMGTTVTWTNRDDSPHTVVSTSGLFTSNALDTDEKFSFTFSDRGTFLYFCSLHPKMTAKIVVE
jgi:plastocyanin